MDSLQDLVGKYTPKEPPEIAAIKQYVKKHFKSEVNVGFQGEAIVVMVPGAAFANTLRFHIAKLQAAAETEKKIILRIS